MSEVSAGHFSGDLQSLGNPFRGSIVGDPWKPGGIDSDVARIHKRVFDTCCAAVDAARSGRGSAGVIINGEPGSGKTHLIARLRKQLTEHLLIPNLEVPRQVFACVRLDSCASSLARHVRRRVVDDLLRRSGGPSQFERLVVARMMEFDNGAGHIALWWEHFREERTDDCLPLLTELCLQDSISPTFVQVLVHLVRQQHRLEVMAWLRGDPLTPAALEKLGVASEDPEEHPEQLAARFLSDLLRLAGGNSPLVLCFDQVEALQQTPDDVQSLFTFGQLISQLHDADNNLAIISCMQSSLYRDVVRSLPAPLLDRISGFATESLNPLDEELAALLLGHRLQVAGIDRFRPAGADSLWPFTHRDVAAMVGSTGISPRRLLEQAARRFDQFAERPVAAARDPLADEWEKRLEQAYRDSSEQETPQILRASIPHLFTITHPDWKVQLDPTQDDLLDVVVTAPQGAARIGIKVCDSSPIRLSAQLRKLCQRFPQTLNVGKLVLLRDERSPISRTAAATQKYLQQLEASEAHYLRVAPEAVAALNALRELLADARSGDLSFAGGHVSADTVIEWLRSVMPPPLAELAEQLTAPATEDHSTEDSVVERLQESLARRRVCAVAEIAAELGCSIPKLMADAAERPDMFGVLEGAQPVIFSVRQRGTMLIEP